MILRDFNVRVQNRLENEKEAIGPYVFGTGEAFAQQQAQITIESIDLFMQLCPGHVLILTNTFFQTSDVNNCTDEEMNTDGFKEPWTPDSFNMLDLCLLPERWKTRYTT